MFKVTKDPQFTHQVPVEMPVDGGHETQHLTVRYRAVNTTDLGRDSIDDLLTGAGQVAFLKKVVVRIDDLVGDDDQPLSWNDSVRDTLFGLTFVRSALINHYADAVSKARSGN